MTSYLLDTGPLGQLAHPRPNQDFITWFKKFIANEDVTVFVPEISDYELRRNLILENFSESITRLNLLEETLEYLPLNTNAIRTASDLWAQVRRRGRPSAHEHALDGDVILAAQAQQVNGTVITANVDHLEEIVNVITW